MSDPVLAEKDASAILSEALAIYKAQTGVTLAPADPRRLHLQSLLLLLAQQRQLIDFSGKQSLLRFVSAQWIGELAALWDEAPLQALPSACTVHFAGSPFLVPAGTRVTDGTNIWEVVGGPYDSGDFGVDVPVQCAVSGSATNGVAIGQIATLVDPITNCSGVSNTTETISGRDIETTEAFRARLRSVPESRSTCGPRIAYEANALEASASVADAVALGADDSGEMAGTAPNPGEVHIIMIEGARDANGNLVSVIPTPSSGLLAAVLAALSAEDVRPLTDHVITKAAQFVDFDINATYYIGRSRAAQVTQIQAAVASAHAAYSLWQQSSIGRDINPSELTTMLVNAGAKRVAIVTPTFSALARDQSARLVYDTLIYGGVEDD